MSRRASVLSHRTKTAPGEGRVQPSNLEAEQSVLGGILLEPGALDRLADILAPEDFYHEAHEKIYAAMLDLYRRREPVDLVTVIALMSDRKILDAVGGPGFLASLTDNVGSAANIEYWGNIVHEKSILRRLITLSNEIAAQCYEPISDVEVFLDEAENRVFTIAESKMRQGFHTLNTLVEKEISLLEALYGRQEIDHRCRHSFPGFGWLHRRLTKFRSHYSGGAAEYGQNGSGFKYCLQRRSLFPDTCGGLFPGDVQGAVGPASLEQHRPHRCLPTPPGLFQQ